MAEGIERVIAPDPRQVSDEPERTVAEDWNRLPLEDRVVETLHSVYDPEIPVDIYELGLIYEVNVSADGDVEIIMTLTAPSCPAAGQIPEEIEQRVRALDGVRAVTVEVVWEPPWTKDRMSETARLELGFF